MTTEQRQRNRRMVRQILEDSECMTCGETDPDMLCFHHRDPDEKYKKISLMVNQNGMMAILEEVDKCDVMCHNDHMKYEKQQHEA